MRKQQRNYYIEAEDINGNIQTISYPLTCDFTITRNTMGGIQEADFTIYNLGQNTRRLLNKNTVDFSPNNLRSFKFYAGYGATNLPLVFQGQVLTCNSVREEGSPDWETNFACQDPGLLPTASVSLPITPQQTRAQGIQGLVGLMNQNASTGVSLGLIGPGFQPDSNFLRNISFSGSYLQILGQMTGGNLSGGNYFFENQLLNILQPNEAFQNDGITTLSINQGLLGAPYYEQTWVFANVLFEPRIKMGQLLDLQSIDQPWLNGKKKVVAYTHSGIISESVGGKCQTQIQLFATLNSAGFQIIAGEN